MGRLECGHDGSFFEGTLLLCLPRGFFPARPSFSSTPDLMRSSTLITCPVAVLNILLETLTGRGFLWMNSDSSSASRNSPNINPCIIQPFPCLSFFLVTGMRKIGFDIVLWFWFKHYSTQHLEKVNCIVFIKNLK